jgi:hypothetical protein
MPKGVTVADSRTLCRTGIGGIRETARQVCRAGNSQNDCDAVNASKVRRADRGAGMGVFAANRQRGLGIGNLRREAMGAAKR